jgi:hypothetical protein
MQSSETLMPVGQRELALDACCAALVAIESVSLPDRRADLENAQRALDRAIGSLRQVIVALHPPGARHINGDGVGMVFTGASPDPLADRRP